MTLCCILRNKTTGTPVPLKHQSLHLNAYNQLANVTITQKYVNEEQSPIEALFIFPTPAEASVYFFEAKTNDGKIIKCLIKEKAEAIKEYNQAISEGNTGFLMERNDGDVFSVAIGNLAPKAEVELCIKYVTELKNEENCQFLRINMPLTLMPKYSPPDTSITVHKGVNPPKTDERPFTMSITGELNMTDGIVSLNCKTHKIKISNMRENTLTFAIEDMETLDQDIVMTVERKAPESIAMTQELTGVQLINPLYKHCTTVNIVPDFSKLAPINVNDVHYSILLDKSGSMEGVDIENCKKAAKNFVALLPTGSIFDTYAFDDSFEKFKDESTEIGERKKHATEWIDKIRADGGTELMPVLTEIYNSLREKKSAVIIVLSDGGISNTEDVFKLVKSNPNVSIFSIGIGSNVSQGLIQGLATNGNGYAEFIGSGDTNIVQKVMSQLKRSQDTLRKYQDNYNIGIECSSKYRLVPEKMPTLYDRTNNILHVFSETPLTTVTYSETLNGGVNIKKQLSVEPITDPSFPLHRVAGVKLLNHLQDQKSGSRIEHLKEDIYKDEIVAISKDLNVLSKYTSFVGVEFKEAADKITGPTLVREVPLETPRKYKGGQEKMMMMMNMSSMMPSMDSIDECCLDMSTPSQSKSSNFSAKMSKSSPNTNSFAAFSIGRSIKESAVNLLGFKGSQGQQSSQGPHGQSSQGSQGSQSPRGPQGSQNPRGPQGSQGQGATGSQGPRSPHSFNNNEHEKAPANPKTPKKQFVIKLVVSKPLSIKYTVLSGGLLTAILNGKFPLTLDSGDFIVGDHIELCGEGKSVNGVYEIISLGSHDAPWVLMMVN